MSETKTYTEAGLTDALKRHDSEAFQYLYHNYKGALYTVIRQIIPDKENAADVLQEVFIIACNLLLIDEPVFLIRSG